jgi:hypothetical protein
MQLLNYFLLLLLMSFTTSYQITDKNPIPMLMHKLVMLNRSNKKNVVNGLTYSNTPVMAMVIMMMIGTRLFLY